MTSMLGPQGSEGGGLDLLAVNRDADLLDLLARRAPVPAGDPVLAMLAALAADVDEGLDELLVASEDDPLVRAASASSVLPGPPAARRGHGLRATTVAIVVGATLSIGGVAAAVTGDPLAPVKGIVSAMGGEGAVHHPGKARAFGADKQARAQLRHGDIAGAQASLAAMKAELLRDDLSTGDRQAIEARIAALQKRVDHAVALAAGPQGDGSEPGDGNSQDNGKADEGTGSNGTASGHGDATSTGGNSPGKPQATRTTEPDAGEQGDTSDGKKAEPTTDATSGATSGGGQSSHAAGSGSRPRQSSPSSSDDSEDAPAPATATSDPSATSGDSGDSDAQRTTGSSTAATKGAATGR